MADWPIVTDFVLLYFSIQVYFSFIGIVFGVIIKLENQAVAGETFPRW